MARHSAARNDRRWPFLLTDCSPFLDSILSSFSSVPSEEDIDHALSLRLLLADHFSITPGKYFRFNTRSTDATRVTIQFLDSSFACTRQTTGYVRSLPDAYTLR